MGDMRLTPRQGELDVVERILNSEDFETSRDMARAIIVAVGQELGHRDFYVMPWSLPGEGGGVNYGPFATLTELRRFAGRMPDGEHGAVLVLGPDRPRAAGDDENAGVCVCRHAHEQHVVRNVRGGKVSAPAECGVYKSRNTKCPCAGYEKGR